ncbi:MAG: hypothetical protein ACE37F_17200 [Nannocystaceae bacterium]|nr:hypothetical protein [bacterium]
MTFDGNLSALGILTLSLCAFACDNGSVGEFESDDGGASSGASTSASAGEGSTSADTDGGSESESATSTSGPTTTDATSSTQGGTETGGSSTSGGPVGVCAGVENHMCSGPVDCGDACGELDSMFDDDGCVREACGQHDDCDDAWFCYRPLNYGGCQSSDVSCSEDADVGCQCATLPDCGGAYCVPEEIVFAGASPGPTAGWATDSCAPDDGPAFLLRVGTYTSDGCGGAFAEDEPLVEFRINAPLGSTGSYVSDEFGIFVATYHPGDGSQVPVTGAVTVTSAGDVLEGEYEARLPDDTVVYGSFSAIGCPSDEPLPCG